MLYEVITCRLEPRLLARRTFGYLQILCQHQGVFTPPARRIVVLAQANLAETQTHIEPVSNVIGDTYLQQRDARVLGARAFEQRLDQLSYNFV